MSLAAKLSQEFTTKIRKRGLWYFQSRKVKILSSSPTQVEAEVRGTRNYVVQLTLGWVSLDVSCTCPYFEGGEECKHIWATSLQEKKRDLADAIISADNNLIRDITGEDLALLLS